MQIRKYFSGNLWRTKAINRGNTIRSQKKRIKELSNSRDKIKTKNTKLESEIKKLEDKVKGLENELKKN